MANVLPVSMTTMNHIPSIKTARSCYSRPFIHLQLKSCLTHIKFHFVFHNFICCNFQGNVIKLWMGGGGSGGGCIGFFFRKRYVNTFPILFSHRSPQNCITKKVKVYPSSIIILSINKIIFSKFVCRNKHNRKIVINQDVYGSQFSTHIFRDFNIYWYK